MAAPKNPKPYKSDKPWREALTLALHERDPRDKSKMLRRVAEACVAKALDGDMSAIKEIGDRLDGRPVQPVSGGDGGDITIKVVTGVPDRTG